MAFLPHSEFIVFVRVRHALCCWRWPIAIRWLTDWLTVFSTHQLAIPYRFCFFFGQFYLFTYRCKVRLGCGGEARARVNALRRRCLVLSITWIMLNSKLYLISNNLLLSVEGSCEWARARAIANTKTTTIYVETADTNGQKQKKKKNTTNGDALRIDLCRLCPFQTWSLFCVSLEQFRMWCDFVTCEMLYIRHNLPSCSRFVMCRRAI